MDESYRSIGDSPGYRALCEELIDALESNHQTWRIPVSPLIARARAALAAEADGPAVPEGREPASVIGEPSDEELLDLAQHHSVSYTMSDGTVVYPLQHGSDMRDDVLSFARAVLARFGHQPAPPVEGEVGELVALIRQISLAWEPDDWLLGNMTAGQLTRAADLLEQRHPAPVPVSVEREGAND